MWHDPCLIAAVEVHMTHDKEESMYAGDGNMMIAGREDATRAVVYTTLYDLIAAVSDTIEPGEADVVAPLGSNNRHSPVLKKLY
jgi:hypothetical protein